jgi:hypothetical protein
MKSIKTNTNSAKGPDKGKIVNKLYCILLHNLYIFFRLNRILTELHRSFFYIFFFQEKMLGDISFKLETKIMNFMSVFFSKKI